MDLVTVNVIYNPQNAVELFQFAVVLLVRFLIGNLLYRSFSLRTPKGEIYSELGRIANCNRIFKKVNGDF